jgi:glutathione S-transferase
MASEDGPRFELYWAPGTCGLVTAIALEEIGASVVDHIVARGWRRNPEYLALNPKGRVPLLLIDGVALTETPAIVTLLARLYPEGRLLPSEPMQQAQALSLMSWFSSSLHPLGGRTRHPAGTNDDPASFERTSAIAANELRMSFGLIERTLDQADWLFRDWSAVDGYLMWLWSKSVGTTVDPQDFPCCSDHARRCALRPSVARALERERAASASAVAA